MYFSIFLYFLCPYLYVFNCCYFRHCCSFSPVCDLCLYRWIYQIFHLVITDEFYFKIYQLNVCFLFVLLFLCPYIFPCLPSFTLIKYYFIIIFPSFDLSEYIYFIFLYLLDSNLNYALPKLNNSGTSQFCDLTYPLILCYWCHVF